MSSRNTKWRFNSGNLKKIWGDSNNRLMICQIDNKMDKIEVRNLIEELRNEFEQKRIEEKLILQEIIIQLRKQVKIDNENKNRQILALQKSLQFTKNRVNNIDNQITNLKESPDIDNIKKKLIELRNTGKLNTKYILKKYFTQPIIATKHYFKHDDIKEILSYISTHMGFTSGEMFNKKNTSHLDKRCRFYRNISDAPNSIIKYVYDLHQIDPKLYSLTTYNTANKKSISKNKTTIKHTNKRSTTVR